MLKVYIPSLWEYSLPITVAWAQFSDLASYLGWVCRWSASFLQGFLSGSSGFFPPQKPTLHFQSDQETVEPFNGKYTAIFPQDFWQIIFSARSLNHYLETTKIKGPYERHTGTSFRKRNTYVGALECLKAPPGAVCA